MYDIDFLILKKFYNNNKEIAFTKEEFRKIFEEVGSEFNEHQKENPEDRIDSLYRDDKYLKILNKGDENKNLKYNITKRGILEYEDELKKRTAQKTRETLQDQLLSNSVRSNKLSPIFAGLAGLFAFASVVVAILNYCKSNEKLTLPLQQLDTTLQKQRILIDSFVRYTKGVQSELHRLTDSLTKKPEHN